MILKRSHLLPLGVFLVALLGLLATVLMVAPEKAPDSSVASIGGPFRLTNQDGKPFSSTDLNGKPFAIFFGFTHCPDVCPTTLYDLTQDLAALGADADKLNVVFVTVDPARDDKDLMKTYLSSFDPRIIGLTGTEEEIAAVAKAYRVLYRKVPTDSGYTMDHTASVFLMDGKGRFFAAANFQEPAETRLGKLKRLIKEG